MKKLLVVLITLLSSITVIGCSGSIAKPVSSPQKIDITYFSIVYHNPDI